MSIWKHIAFTGITLIVTALPARRVFAATQDNSEKPLVISYTLQKSQRVSLNVYDAKGQIVRELLHGAARIAGNHREKWDGRDDAGKPVAAGQYSWKMLGVPGFGTEYITSPGSNYPVKDSDPFWATAPGSHGGPSAITVAPDGIWVGAGGNEGIELGLLKQSLDGKTRLYSGKGGSYVALAAVGKTLWQYQAPGTIYGGAAPISPIYNNEGASDMAANETNIILCYPNAGVVRWLDLTGKQTKIVNVPGAKGVDVAPDGAVYVIAGPAMLKISSGGDAAQPFISTGLSTPVRAAVSPTNGDIYILDGATFGPATIKRYNSAGVLQQSYGAPTGREYGKYDAVQKLNHTGSTDITVEANGNFWVADGNTAPRRVARFNLKGDWLGEWYGGQEWAPWITVEPDDPSFVWVGSAWGDFMRAKVDYAHKTWSVDSTFPTIGQGGGLIGGHYNAEDWQLREHDGTIYLCRMGGVPAVLKFDRENRKLIPVSIAITNFWRNDKPQWVMKMANGNRSMLWTDANGDGTPLNADGSVQTNEVKFFPDEIAYATNSTPDSNLNYITAGGATKFRVTGWNAVGAPIYGTLPAGEKLVAPPPRFGGNYDDRWSDYVTADTAGNIWGGFNPNIWGWGGSSDAFVARWNPDGTLAWQSGRMNGKPGSLGTLRHIYGVIDNGANYKCLVIGRFSYEWESEGVTPVYVYDQDGLYAGQLLAKPVNQGNTANWRYGLGGEGLSGTILKDKSGEVYFYGNWINEGRVYRITGWNTPSTPWQRTSGSITVPTGYDAPPLIEEPIGPNGKGTGLIGRYWIDWQGDNDPGFQGNPITTRMDADVNFPYVNSPNLGGWGIYSARWTGTITPRRSGWHMFQNAGSRSNNIWVNGVLVAFDPGGIGRALWLNAGQVYPIKIEYTYRPGNNGLILQWAEPETNSTFSTVPQSQLSPDEENPILQMTDVDLKNETAFPASATDLINAGQPTLASRTETDYKGAAGTRADALNDGTVGKPSDAASMAYDDGASWTSTFTLNTTTNTKGYDLSEINVFSGAVGAPASQKFELSYTTVKNPTPVSLGTFEYVLNFTTSNGNMPSSAKMVIRRKDGVLASGVKSLIFKFLHPKTYLGTAGTAYREIDALGKPTTAGVSTAKP